MVRMAGLEPARQIDTSTSSWPVCLFQHIRILEQVTGIEPASPAWKAGALTIVLHLHIMELVDGLEPPTC